jgi:micrococcal nuclease
MVRLVAINAPDRGECLADQARDYLIDTLRGETVRVEEIGTDQFDRTLGHVFVGDRHVNLEMVTMGLALASTPEESDSYRRAILDAEEAAYSNGVGLWAVDACGGSGEPAALSIDSGSSQPDPGGPDGANLGAELIVIRNDGDDAVDLGGWMIRDESTRHRFTFAEGTSIAPGESISVSSDSSGWDPGDGPVWNNEGDMALIQDPAGNIVARWRY